MAGMAANRLYAQTQQQIPEWEKAAGGTADFEVAAVHKDAPDAKFQRPSFPLSPDDSFREPNGNFHADFSVSAYIEFAYKLWLSDGEKRVAFANIPDWVLHDRYTLEAKAPLHATKDQYRLMMQSLLAERFGVRVHFEDREMSVLAMELIKPGKPGPKLIPHENGPPCDSKSTDIFPSECYGFVATAANNGQMKAGSRATSMEWIGNFIGNIGGRSGEVTRPVVDRTGLNGLWDFSVVALPPDVSGAPNAEEATGSTLLEAVREQLGLKLVPTRAKIQVMVVDHVERPSEN